MNRKKSPKVISSIEEYRRWYQNQNLAQKKVGVVTTMGALHAGHEELLHQSRSNVDISILTIFVNPMQFGKNEDLDQYPKTFEKDLEAAQRQEVDIVFAPRVEDIYPKNFSMVVKETVISKPWCGANREGHFDGVATVVLKLFNILKPNFTYFGLKDLQQYLVVKTMIEQLDLDIELKGVPTVRESDGLALSSRNAYLSESERKKAPFIYQTLRKLQSDPSQDHVLKAIQNLKDEGFEVQYLERRRLSDLSLVTDDETTEPTAIAVAAYLGKTRLIDNILINPPETL